MAMMPVIDALPPQIDLVDYKKKYKAIKKKLKLLLYEHECFLEELRKSQRKLLKVSRDRSFLLDRLMHYETVEDSSSDSDLTASSDSETETRESTSHKRKLSAGINPIVYGEGAMSMAEAISFQGLAGAQLTQQQQLLQQLSQQQQLQLQAAGSKPAGVAQQPPKKKAKITKQTKAGATPKQQTLQIPGHLMAQGDGMVTKHLIHPATQQQITTTTMTREELERHLEFKQSSKPQYMSLGQAMNTLPDDIFGNEDSNQGLIEVMKEEDDDDSEHLILDAS